MYFVYIYIYLKWTHPNQINELQSIAQSLGTTNLSWLSKAQQIPCAFISHLATCSPAEDTPRIETHGFRLPPIIGDTQKYPSSFSRSLTSSILPPVPDIAWQAVHVESLSSHLSCSLDFGLSDFHLGMPEYGYPHVMVDNHVCYQNCKLVVIIRYTSR